MVANWILAILSIAFCYGHIPAHRLANDIIPEHYRLDIVTNLSGEGNFTFEGKVWIKIKCIESTSVITLHSKQLIIDYTNVTLNYVETKTRRILSVPEIVNQELDTNNDFYNIRLQKPLKANHNLLLFIPFQGVLSEGMTGYYRSSYLDRSTGQTRWLSVTQFESTYARRAFPCFDEPSMKAKFQINLAHDEQFSSISNMPIKKTEMMLEKPGWVWNKFEDTVPMSTYLVAYIVSDFGHELAPATSLDPTFRVWARNEALGQVEYAKNIGPQYLKYFEEYFEIKYPLPKLDMVAIPDFSTGAMENWGLITYREKMILYDPNESSASSQHDISSVIAHELAHQWFGNLVTMKWWTDLWLNEGFATYVATVGVHHIHPEWNSLEDQVVENTLEVFSFDSLKSSHPVSVPIDHPDQIAQIFDAISYKKGSSIIRMMNLFLGEKTFRTGVNNYLKKHKYGNAEQDDLWESLTKAAHETEALNEGTTIKEIMDTWTLQTGYPLVTVKRNYDAGSAELSQARFLMDSDESHNFSEERWWIPVSYTTPGESNFNRTQPKQWINCDSSGGGTIEGLDYKDEWVILNIQMAGVYKVNYDIQNWNLLIQTLNSPKYNTIHSLNRVQVIEDIMDLAWTGYQSYDVALGLFNYLHREVEYLPWKTAIKKLGELKRRLQLTPSYGLFKMYVRGVIAPIYKRKGGLLRTLSSTSLDAVRHQALINNWGCLVQLGDCTKEAIILFNDWQTQEEPDKLNPIPKDLRYVIYCTAIRHGGRTQWDFLWSRYLNTNVATELSTILLALGCTDKSSLINRYLYWTLGKESGIRKQDAGTVFKAVAKNTVGFGFAKEFLKTNIRAIHDYHSPTPGVELAEYIIILAKQMATSADLDELTNFTADASEYLEGSQLGVKQALEIAKINSQWTDRHYQNFSKLLKEINKTPQQQMLYRIPEQWHYQNFDLR